MPPNSWKTAPKSRLMSPSGAGPSYLRNVGELLLLKMLKELEEYGAAESLPKMEGRRMIVMIAPKKKK
jgi:hypothetical protein